jgi:hypothetical protein
VTEDPRAARVAQIRKDIEQSRKKRKQDLQAQFLEDFRREKEAEALAQERAYGASVAAAIGGGSALDSSAAAPETSGVVEGPAFTSVLGSRPGDDERAAMVAQRLAERRKLEAEDRDRRIKALRDAPEQIAVEAASRVRKA